MGFLNGILGFLGGSSDIAQGFLLGLFNLLVYVANFLYDLIAVVAQYAVATFKIIGNFFRHLWDQFFSNIFSRIFRAVRDLADWLETHIRPLIEWLQRAQRYITRLYNIYVRPVLIMIQRIRQVLTILRALHIQWAQDLDNILAHVQSDINGIFLKITGTINAVIDVLNIVTDPERFLRHPMLILSIRRSVLALIRQLTGLPPGFWIPSPKASAPAGTGKLPKNFTASDDTYNPPPSYYMGIAPPMPSLNGWPSGVEVPDDLGDDVEVLDYFGVSAWPSSPCPDGVLCFLAAVETSRVKVANG